MEQDPPGSVPTPKQAVELADLYRLPHEWRDQLVQLAEDHKEQREEHRFVVVRGRNVLHVQRRFRRLEESVQRMRSYSSGVVLGQLQSPRYAAAIFGQPADSEVVRERLARGVQSAANSGRRYEVVMTEGTAYPGLGSAEVMVEQFEHLIEVSRLPHVDLRWIGRGTVLDSPSSVPGFNIYDDTAVVLSQVDGAATLDDPDDILRYVAEFDRLWGAAAAGAEARDALAEVSGWYSRWAAQ
jgi:hypothetical protein